MIKDKYEEIKNLYIELENNIKLFYKSEYIDDWECLYENLYYLFTNYLPNVFRYLNLRSSSDKGEFINLVCLHNKLRTLILSGYNTAYKIKKDNGCINLKDIASEIINDKLMKIIKINAKDMSSIRINNLIELVQFPIDCNIPEDSRDINVWKNSLLSNIIKILGRSSEYLYMRHKEVDEYTRTVFIKVIVDMSPYSIDEEYINLLTNLCILLGYPHTKWLDKTIKDNIPILPEFVKKYFY